MTNTAKAPRAPKTERRVTPGLRRLRKSAAAETIRADVLADQQTGRRKARARIDAKAAQTPKDGRRARPAPEPRKARPRPPLQSQRRDSSAASPSRRLLSRRRPHPCRA